MVLHNKVVTTWNPIKEVYTFRKNDYVQWLSWLPIKEVYTFRKDDKLRR